MNKEQQYTLAGIAMVVIGILISKTPTSTQSLVGLEKITAWFTGMGAVSQFFMFAGLALILVVALAFGSK